MRTVVDVKQSNINYPIYIENGVFNMLDEYIDFPKKTLVISDNNISTRLFEKIFVKANECYNYIIQSGEESKNYNNYLKIMEKLISLNFTRNDLIIALGGGVVGDLSAFVASTYKRGCRFINIPTSSLAMIDSSIGGKTAIDFMNVKNVIGTFYNPELVLIDPQLLETLPKRHFYNGLVEAVKAGLLADKQLFNIFLEEDFEEKIIEIISRSIEVKKKIIETDLFEENERKFLNLGHTIGHAIESIFMPNIYHGEAVAYGMQYFISDELKEKVKKIFNKFGIKDVINLDTEETMKYIKNDKKKLNSLITVVKVDEIENPYLEQISEEDMIAIIGG